MVVILIIDTTAKAVMKNGGLKVQTPSNGPYRPRGIRTMNIYLITEDGSNFCMRGQTMSEVIGLCERSYIEDAVEDDSKTTEEYERKYYHDEILQSCTLVGELKN